MLSDTFVFFSPKINLKQFACVLRCRVLVVEISKFTVSLCSYFNFKVHLNSEVRLEPQIFLYHVESSDRNQKFIAPKTFQQHARKFSENFWITINCCPFSNLHQSPLSQSKHAQHSHEFESVEQHNFSSFFPSRYGQVCTKKIRSMQLWRALRDKSLIYICVFAEFDLNLCSIRLEKKLLNITMQCAFPFQNYLVILHEIPLEKREKWHRKCYHSLLSLFLFLYIFYCVANESKNKNQNNDKHKNQNIFNI